MPLERRCYLGDVWHHDQTLPRWLVLKVGREQPSSPPQELAEQVFFAQHTPRASNTSMPPGSNVHLDYFINSLLILAVVTISLINIVRKHIKNNWRQNN